MDETEALNLLKVGTAEQRIAAAVALRASGSRHELAIEHALSRETNHYVRAQLDATLGKVTPARGTDQDVSSREAATGASADAVVEASAQFVHEVGRYVGFVREAAADEVPEFYSSATLRELDRLEEVVRGIEQLGKMARTPLVAVFDLAGLIEDIVAECQRVAAGGPRVRTSGTRPLLVRSGKAQVDQIVRNAVSNALDAVAEVPLPEIAESGLDLGESELEGAADLGPRSSRDARAVVVTWGVTDEELWVAVLDQGLGLRSGRDPFIFGQTTKSNHVGIGLVVCKSAALALGGTVTLAPRADDVAGCKFEFRCPVSRA